MKLSREELKGLMKNKLVKAGLNEKHADIAAEVMTWSDERGYHSHGAVRVEYYSERIAKGEMCIRDRYRTLPYTVAAPVQPVCGRCAEHAGSQL